MFKPLNVRGSEGDFLHGRSMSNFVRTSGQSPERTGQKNMQQLKKEKMVNMLSTQNFRKQLMNTRKMSAVQAQYRSAETKSKNKDKKK